MSLRALQLRLMAVAAIPEGSQEPFIDGVRFLTDRDRLSQAARDAKRQAQDMVLLVRNGAEPNPWRDSTDDEIAAEIMRRVEALKKRREE